MCVLSLCRDHTFRKFVCFFQFFKKSSFGFYWSSQLFVFFFLSCFICFCFHFLLTWYICFICRFILVLFSCPLLMECSLRFQREIAVHQFHILESILEEDSHICPNRKHKNFLFMLLFITKKEENLKVHQYEYNLLNYAVRKLWNST